MSAAPPVFLTGLPYNEYLGIAGAFARRYGNIKAGFIIFPTWSIENAGKADAIRQKFLHHCERYPNHRFRFMCNTHQETALLEERGLPATFLNKNLLISDEIFRPLPDARVEFDAIYNARFVPEKRHELAAAVPRVAYLAYAEINRQDRLEQFHKIHAEVLERGPGHVLLNPMVDSLPVEIPHQQVNAALSRAAVGLILSKVEGSCYAAVEYLLAGLPVVSTPSKGGRDVHFDPEYCIVCEPEPAAVRDAVATLRARNIPKEFIRARTLAKIRPERDRFLAMLNDLTAELGGERDHGGDWPFGDTSGAPWLRFETHLAAFAERRRADLAEGK